MVLIASFAKVAIGLRPIATFKNAIIASNFIFLFKKCSELKIKNKKI